MDIAKTGSFIKELRKEKGLTQKELADALYITDRAVSKWERGLSAPDISLLQPLSEILNVTITEIITGSRMSDDEPIEKLESNAKEIINYSDREIKKKVSFRKRKIIILTFLLIAAAAAVIPLYTDLIGGDGFGWRCIPAYIKTSKADHAIVNQDKSAMEKYIADSDDMHSQLLALEDEGVFIYSCETDFFRTRLDDSFLFTETEFTVYYNDMTYSFICTGTYRNGKVEFMYLSGGYWEKPEHRWAEKLNEAVCTYNPG